METYLHCEVCHSQTHNHTCAELEEENKKKYKEIEGTVTPAKKKEEKEISALRKKKKSF